MSDLHSAAQQESPTKPERRFYRSVFLSDVHLCTRDAQVDVLYDFIDGMRCDYLYLVGDILDLWQLRKKWYWPQRYNDLLHKILKRSRKGAKVVFIPGNHDEFFRSFVGYQFGDMEVLLNTRHTTVDGKELLVMHGDEFDTVVQYHKWLSHLGSWAYNHLIVLNRVVNAVRRRFGKPYWSLSGAIKRKVKQAVNFANRFETLVIEKAKEEKVDGIVCGHIHQPAMREVEGILYCNTGDWVENCTALVEHTDGRLELVNWHKVMLERAERENAVSTDNPAPEAPPRSRRRFLTRETATAK